MPKYKLIRDKEIFDIPEEQIEVCENRNEIVEFGIKEIINLAMELKSSDCRNLDLYADLIEILYLLGELSFISTEQIEDYTDDKLEIRGGYSKYLKREN